MDKLEEIEARRAARRTANIDARHAQEIVDLTEIDKLEEERGDALHTCKVNRFVPGCVAKLAYRAPTRGEYKRYSDTVFGGRNVAKGDLKSSVEAQRVLGEVCMVYPPKGEAREALLEACPGVMTTIGQLASKLGDAEAEETGKE